ncbi:MAG: hypothetical protein C0613_13065 [Desulfobulbaceae bacterium]|nr:MAG: hypothetical protein C0613_13065 [Desulfobulbaceae bacterium]
MKFVSIKDRLVMVLMITSLTSLVIASLCFFFYEGYRYETFKERHLHQIVDLLAVQARQHLLDGNREEAEEWLEAVTQHANIKVVGLYDSRGNFFAGRHADERVPPLPQSSRALQDVCFVDTLCSTLSELHYDGKPQGFLFLAADLEHARTSLTSIAVIFFVVTLLTLAIVYVVAFFLHDQFKKPILSLVDTARFICEKKDFKARARKYSSDEMGLLTDTINSMLDEIAGREEEMKKLHEELESRVAARTAALQETNARLLAEKSRADQAASVKSDFLANMSHEIRTPMNGIVAACDLAMDEELPPKVVNYLKIIQESSHSLLLIVNDILDFSRLEAGTLVLDQGLFSLPDLLAELNDFFSVKAHADQIDLIIDMAPEVPALLVGDRGRFRQILYNLVDNGLKFTHKGMVSLYVSCLEKDDRSAVLEVRVRDTGVGLSPAAMERIFSSFHQEDSSSTRQFGGTGLGLAISRRLARMMGGTIEVESELGKGATFIVMVRMGWKEAEGGNMLSGRSPAGGDDVCHTDFRGLHALIVEDNETNRGVAEAMLTGMGITVESVVDGREAVEITADNRYDVILMDMQMPVMDGYEAITHIRRDSACKDVPIVAMTAHALSGDREKCLQAGADAYIGKPVHKKRLQTVLATVLADLPLLADSDRHSFADLATGAEFIPDQCPIDMEKAVRQLGVPDDVYRRVLATFCRDYQDFQEEYRRYAGDNDIGKIKKMVHSLKGSSATIGAESLSQLATEADRLCKHEKIPSAMLEKRLLTCLEEVLSFARNVVASEEEGVIESADITVREPEKVLQQLHDLADSLDQSMYDAINICLEEVEKNLSGKKIASLSKMIRMYSYEEALALVRELIDEFESSGGAVPRQDG